MSCIHSHLWHLRPASLGLCQAHLVVVWRVLFDFYLLQYAETDANSYVVEWAGVAKPLAFRCHVPYLLDEVWHHSSVYPADSCAKKSRQRQELKVTLIDTFRFLPNLLVLVLFDKFKLSAY